MTENAYQLNPRERRILAELQRDGRVSNVELAGRVGMSESPCLRRVRTLEEAGVIAGYHAQVDRRRLGLDVLAFVQVGLDQRSETDTEAFLQAVRREPRIIAGYAMSGSHDYMLKVVARSMDDFSDLTMRTILRWPGVQNVSSTFVMEEIKESSELPL